MFLRGIRNSDRGSSILSSSSINCDSDNGALLVVVIIIVVGVVVFHFIYNHILSSIRGYLENHKGN